MGKKQMTASEMGRKGGKNRARKYTTKQLSEMTPDNRLKYGPDYYKKIRLGIKFKACILPGENLT